MLALTAVLTSSLAEEYRLEEVMSVLGEMGRHDKLHHQCSHKTPISITFHVHDVVRHVVVTFA